jgi:hypothetical protein
VSSTSLTTEQVLDAAEESDIVHLTCCLDDAPARVALCGWICTEEALDDEGPECVVCCDIADGFHRDECVHGGRCP